MLSTALLVLNILLISNAFLYVAFILFHIIAWVSIKKEEQPGKPCKTTVSVIIAARNEEKNIGRCLQSILEQDYPMGLFEIIVCDDHSEDNTKIEAEKILNGSTVRSKYVLVTELPSHKKKAIAAGIQEAGGELIIITDADCTVEKRWVSSMVSVYEQNDYKMLCGTVAISNEKNFCEKFQSLEVAGLSILSAGGIYAGIPLLCNGANMAYSRKAYEEVHGFKGIDDIPTGDDTLLMFKMNKKFSGKIGFVKSKGAFVYTNAQPIWKDFIQQRIRWASKGLYSKSILNSIVSILVFVTNFLLLVYPVSLFVGNNSLLVWFYCLVAKLAVDFLLVTCASVFFTKRRLLLYFPAAEIITVLYMSYIGLVASYGSYQWKGRKY